jgi:hypothetical protein
MKIDNKKKAASLLEAAPWSFYIQGRSVWYFNQRSSFGFWVLVLYQGTTLVGPHRMESELGFSPC